MAGSNASPASLSGGRWIGPPTVFHGEGAFWDAGAQLFRYVDMLSGDVISDPDGVQSRTHMGDVAALIRSRSRGGLVVAEERGFVLTDDDMLVQRRIPVFDDETVRMNEGGCDSAGRLYCGSMAYDARPGAGRLYRLDPDLSVHVVLERVTIPNGLVWPAGDRVALHAETADRKIYAYAFDPGRGELGGREVFVDCADAAGAPDGMALDVEGGLWVAMWGGGAVRRYDPSGSLTDVLELPVTNVTSCAFGGSSGSTLLVTTSRDGIPGGSQPYAGRTYEIDVGVRGAPVNKFGG